MSTITYTPARNTLEDEDRRPYTIVRSEDWNGNFRMLGRQGNNIDSYLSKLSPYLGSFDDTQLNIIATVLNTLVLKENISDSNLLCSSILYNSASGVITFKNRSGGTMATIDLNIEKIPVSIHVEYRTGGWYIVITNTDGTETSCPVGELFKPVTFQDSTRIDFTETTLSTGAKAVTADIKSHSIGYDQLATEPFAEIRTAVSATAADKAAADASADDAYLSAEAAATSATAAAGSATSAAGSVTSAAAHATQSQSWAVGGTGTRTGENTNNSKYYSELSAASAQSASQSEDAAEAAQEKAEAAVSHYPEIRYMSSPTPGYYWFVWDAENEAYVNTNVRADGGGNAAWGMITGNLSNQTDLVAALDAKYEKPAAGIPKADLASGVQTSLGLADTALQTHQDISGKANVSDLNAHTGNSDIHVTAADKTSWNAKYTKPSGGIPAADISGIPYVTTTPTAANTDGLKIAILTTIPAPASQLDGWLYLKKG